MTHEAARMQPKDHEWVEGWLRQVLGLGFRVKGFGLRLLMIGAVHATALKAAP